MLKLYKLKRLSVFSSLVISVLIMSSPQIFPQNLVGQWAMEESDGATVLTDSSSYGNNANVTGSLVSVAGQRGIAQEFDGTNDYALVPDDASLDITGAITLAAWIKPTTTGTQYIIKKATKDVTDGYELSLSSTGQVFVRFNQLTSNNLYRKRSSILYPTDGNTWMHIAATYDGTDIRLYINGVKDGLKIPGPGSIALNDLSLSIGAQNNGARKFQGAIDDVRIYNYVLTHAEILALTTTWPPLVGQWAMEESDGATVLTDSSSYGNNANVTGSLVSVAGQRGIAQEFDGTNDYALVPDDASLDITGAITLAAWIKPTTTGTQYIIKKATKDVTDGYELSLSSTGQVFVRFNQLTSNNLYRKRSSILYPTDGNTWMHIAATYDGTDIRLYINGVKDGLKIPGPGSIALNDLSLSIGAQNNGARKFQGAIDDVRIYNYVLTHAEILALTTTWIPPEPPVLLSPADESTEISTTTTLSWNAPTGATSYRLQVSTVSNFSSTVFDQANITETSTQVTGLDENTVNYWRVNATGGTGSNSVWSSIWNFTTVLSTENNGAGCTLDLDGTNDYVNCGSNSSVDITGALTMEAWVNPDVVSTQSVIKKNTETSGYELSLSLSGKVFVRLNGSYRIDSGTSYPYDGSWTHIAATYDGTTMKLYINGVLEGTLTGPTLITSNSNNLVIGTDAAALETKNFNGRLDEVRLWNVARTEGEIREYMCTKISGSLPSNLVGYWNFNEPEGNLMSDQTANSNDGLLTNRDGDEHTWSGAPIGDASTYDFDATGGYTISLTHSDGDAITATTSSGTITGILAYRVDDNSLRTGSTVPSGYIVDPIRYWGVKVIGSGPPTYDVEYNYSNHPGLGTEADLRLVKRNNISGANWVDAGATLDEGENTLTKTSESGTEYALASISAPLPVELVSFTAEISDNTVILKWQTETEVDNYGFDIERKSENTGIQTWKKIGFIEGNGNSNSPKLYSFVDGNVDLGKYYYHLKQVDTDGSFTYSEIIEVDLGSLTNFEISQNYPNPFNPSTIIKYSIPEERLVILKVFSAIGEEIISLVNEVKQPGVYETEFNVSNIPSGIYFYRIQAGSFVETKKMVLMR